MTASVSCLPHLFRLGHRTSERVYLDARLLGPYTLTVWTEPGSDRLAIVVSREVRATTPPGGGTATAEVAWSDRHSVSLAFLPGSRRAVGGYRVRAPGRRPARRPEVTAA